MYVRRSLHIEPLGMWVLGRAPILFLLLCFFFLCKAYSVFSA